MFRNNYLSTKISFCNEMEKSGITSYIVKATVERNETVDRLGKDWNDNKGRAVI